MDNGLMKMVDWLNFLLCFTVFEMGIFWLSLDVRARTGLIVGGMIGMIYSGGNILMQ